MRGPGSRPSLLFRLIVPSTAVFIVTIMALIAVVFSDPRAPAAQWLNQYGNRLLLVEFVVVLVLATLAMGVDRWSTLQAAARNSDRTGTATDAALPVSDAVCESEETP